MPETCQDYTQTIQNQVDAIRGKNGIIRIPIGNWSIAQRIDINWNGAIIIEGEGPGVTTIKCNSADRTFHFGFGNHCAVKSLRLVGDPFSGRGVTNIPAIHFNAGLAPIIENCWFTDHDTGIMIGGEGCVHKARISNVSFEACRICINLDNQIETTITNVLGDVYHPDPPTPGLEAIIYADPPAGKCYDSLIIHNVKSFTPRKYGIFIKIDKGEKSVNGRNHIGQFGYLIFENCQGIYVDALATHGRFDLSNYYGEKVEIKNCHNLRISHGQFDYGLVLSGCPSPQVVCSGGNSRWW